MRTFVLPVPVACFKTNLNQESFKICLDIPSESNFIKSEDDLIFNFDDVSVFIDPSSFKFLKGTKVDFLVEGVNEGIKFLNPNVKAVCGCGESFQVDI